MIGGDGMRQRVTTVLEMVGLLLIIGWAFLLFGVAWAMLAAGASLLVVSWRVSAT